MTDGNDRREPDFHQVRVGAAVGLTAALIGLLFIDAFDPGYEVNSVTLGILAAMILTLLGLEARDILRR